MRLNSAGLTAAAFALSAVTSAFAASYTENFDDGNAASRFDTVLQNSARTDYTADYAFNYASLGIGLPQAGQTTTTGLKLAVNQTDAAITGIQSYVKGLNLTGGAVMTFDMYDYFGTGTGASTIYSTYGFYHTTETGLFNSSSAGITTAPATSLATSGYWFSTVPDSGSSSNYRALKVASNEGTAANYLSGSQAGTAAGYQTLFPANNANELAGYIRNRWVNVRITRDPDTGLIKEEMKNPEDADYTTIFSITDNTTPQTGGTVTLGMTDPFASASSTNAFYIYDNLQVVYTPEPASLSLLGIAGIGLLTRRRA